MKLQLVCLAVLGAVSSCRMCSHGTLQGPEGAQCARQDCSAGVALGTQEKGRGGTGDTGNGQGWHWGPGELAGMALGTHCSAGVALGTWGMGRGGTGDIGIMASI